MRKPFILLLFLFVLNLFSQSETKPSPIICTSFMETDKIRVVLSCQSSEAKECVDGGIITVRVTPSMLDLKIPKVKYEVSGGKIIGEGELVKWDLRGVKPGHYTVTAEVEEKDGFPQKGTKTVTVIECERCNEPEGVNSVNLDRTQVTLACPIYGTFPKSSPCSEEHRKIKINTVSENAEKNRLNYYYFVTGGNIIGQGANVIWDLSGVKPGDYSVTIGVGESNIIKGNIVTKNVIANACECYIPCNCPSISISSPNRLTKRNEAIIFTAETNGGTQDHIKYKWSVSNGIIVAGQGTRQILVKSAPNVKDNVVTATVEFSGLCTDSCPKVAFASAEFEDK